MIKPILFNADMIRAILDGRKTVTRRVVKGYDKYEKLLGLDLIFPMQIYKAFNSPCEPGDILRVREAWCEYIADHVIDGVKYAYRADTSAESERFRKELGYKWRPSIHMPREAARIWLRVTGVRAERLQHITRNDAIAEGCNAAIPVMEFKGLWDRTIKPTDRERYGWAANPWVWRIEFERCAKPETGGACRG